MKKIVIQILQYRYLVPAVLLSLAGLLVAMFSAEVPESVFTITKFVPFLLTGLLLQFALQRSLFSKPGLVSLLLSIPHILTVPLLFWYAGVVDEIVRPRRDILFGLYLLLTLFSGIVIGRRKNSRLLLASTLSVGGILLFLPLAELVHFVLYGSIVTEGAVYAMLATDVQEAAEYIGSYVGYPAAVAIVLGILLPLAVFYFLFRRKEADREPLHIAAIVLAVLVSLLTGTVYLGKTDLIRKILTVAKFRSDNSVFLEGRNERFARFRLDEGSELMTNRISGTVIVVIGESASRDYMQVYSPDFAYPDTPWLSSVRNDGSFVMFEHAYACYNQTEVALKNVLTEASQYNGLSFGSSLSIIDVARKAGFKTYWFTNQNYTDLHSAPVTMIAQTAHQLARPQVRYDHEMLKLLEESARDRERNRLIVIHMMGSHAEYSRRYPEDYNIFRDGGKTAEYANTIAYGDEFLRKVFSLARQKMNLQLMVYFSDHGENIEKGHHPSIRSFDTLRIPLVVYASPEYQKAYPEKFAMLRTHRGEYFTNDMFFNTLSGLIGAYSEHYNRKEDLSSPMYGYNRDNTLTFMGTVPLSSDHDGEK